MSFQSDSDLAFVIGKPSVSTLGPLLKIEWAAHGSESNKQPGTLWKATIKPPRHFDPKARSFEIFTPSPYNSRQAAKTLLVRHLKRETNPPKFNHG
jgi:hypothetical protein